MSGSHVMRSRGTGLVSHRRWFDKGLHGLRSCRNDCGPARPMPTSDAKLFAWLLAPETAHRQLIPAAARARAR